MGRVLLAAFALGATACTNLVLSPAPRHEFPKADAKLTAPPPTLLTTPEDP